MHKMPSSVQWKCAIFLQCGNVGMWKCCRRRQAPSNPTGAAGGRPPNCICLPQIKNKKTNIGACNFGGQKCRNGNGARLLCCVARLYVCAGCAERCFLLFFTLYNSINPFALTHHSFVNKKKPLTTVAVAPWNQHCWTCLQFCFCCFFCFCPPPPFVFCRYKKQGRQHFSQIMAKSF